MKRREFVRGAAQAAGAAAVGTAALTTPTDLIGDEGGHAPAVHTAKAARPLVISDVSGIRYTNGGPESQVERAFRGITEGEDAGKLLSSA